MFLAASTRLIVVVGVTMLSKGPILEAALGHLVRHKVDLPEVVRDLPAGGRRLHQRATGYEATIVAGEVIRRFDCSTGARPGQLVRGAGYRPAD